MNVGYYVLLVKIKVQTQINICNVTAQKFYK